MSEVSRIDDLIARKDRHLTRLARAYSDMSARREERIAFWKDQVKHVNFEINKELGLDSI